MADMSVGLERSNGIAILTIDRPPVNALSHELRKLIAARLDEVARDDAIAGLVIACAGRTFVAGADIEELGLVRHPMLRDLIDTLERIGKPSVAAIHGTALGGGFELSLGCTFRSAIADAKIGLPEVKLGLLPGAGGTVRTTYLAGAEAALKLAGTGDMLDATSARDLGLVDVLFDSDLVAGSVRFLADRIAAGNIPSPVSSRARPAERTDDGQLAKMTAELCRKARSSAPEQVAKAVRNAIDLSFDDAMIEERRLFDAAAASPRFRALRHLFFAERAAAKPVETVDAAPPRTVQSVAVIGAGTMGSGIAMAFANSGFDVVVRETGDAALERGMKRIRDTYDRSVTRGSLSREDADGRIGRVSGTTEAEALSAADLIIEAAFEDMAVKKQIFAEIDAIAKPGAILATNTSYLDVNEIARSTRRPSDVLGLHFFSPANVMRLLEVVRGADTAPEVIATVLKVARRLGKQPVVVGVCHGFVGNRMLQARNSQLSRLLLDGADPADVDAAFRNFGWPMGPCQMQDLAGLDISWRNRKALGKVDLLPDRLCENGRLGQKAGKGWYRYENGRDPKPDAEVAALIEELAAESGIARRTVGEQEIIDRTHGPMIDEGRRILEEGVAARASDIDVVWVNGYGFPRDLGGPMYWDEHFRTSSQ
ncbi:3-hydroxyacyl-CoA dehydrogenase NAD-binding domain-containing protein [Oricola sp.]|uniref:3-hydroxyacyl-CoA dehydrogenase NAD-binding domain-containing protein n=1 Tax=Oricola sp. TaxID=1979950 RepID=UPI0025D43EAC|nr:3-hydroxyacyl-CoA dehydrogenase NAD-binding domain-containing protein [Oricola sp.]MCI5076759.1 3-hydroxyacyl-CoA dehydrogenase NAD-binding domain-containing protein [Oricola sp.]